MANSQFVAPLRASIRHLTKRAGFYGFAKNVENFIHTLAYKTLWGRQGYIDFYRRRVRKRAEISPWWAVGNTDRTSWENHGRQMYEFLLENDLNPADKFLDIGCGNLRIGLHVIRYLEPGNYWGIDISPENIATGRRYLSENGLVDKHPRLFINENLDLKELQGTQIDVVLANSVFTHVPANIIEECIASLPKALRGDGAFYATFAEGSQRYHAEATDTFLYQRDFFARLCDDYGFSVVFEDEFRHPHGQTMMTIRHRPSNSL